MDWTSLQEYRYNGARSLIVLHERALTSLVRTWREAKSVALALPETEDANYQSLETLLQHIFRAARGYMMWMCEKLCLPDPGIHAVPESERIDSEADEYLIHLFEQWRVPLVDIDEDKFYTPTFLSNWGVAYCIDAMLEHAVMHPTRHEFQLNNLMSNLQQSSQVMQ